jgi:hypothetical protein
MLTICLIFNDLYYIFFTILADWHVEVVRHTYIHGGCFSDVAVSSNVINRRATSPFIVCPERAEGGALCVRALRQNRISRVSFSAVSRN